MRMHEIKRNTPNKSKKIIGRGGTRGKTSGHGHKGQGQHGGHGIRPAIRDFIKKIPKLRGRGKNINTSIKSKPVVINLFIIDNVYDLGETVSPATLQEKNILKSNQLPDGGVKILADGEITKKLTFSGCLFSREAKEKIEKAGGIIE